MSRMRETSAREAGTRETGARDVYRPVNQLDTPQPRDGECLYWQATGEMNKQAEMQAIREGWEPVKYGEYPDFFAHVIRHDPKKADEVVTNGFDLTLMRHSAAWRDSRKAHFRRMNQGTVESLEAQYRADTKDAKGFRPFDDGESRVEVRQQVRPMVTFR